MAAFGYFTAFGNVARKDSVDYVLHLGDFLYEYAEGGYGYGWKVGRSVLPDKEIRTLYDYRRRHSQYRSDLDAVENFAMFPWIPVWDDHGEFEGMQPSHNDLIFAVRGRRQHVPRWDGGPKQHQGFVSHERYFYRLWR